MYDESLVFLAANDHPIFVIDNSEVSELDRYPVALATPNSVIRSDINSSQRTLFAVGAEGRPGAMRSHIRFVIAAAK